jgi:hypothetical protein
VTFGANRVAAEVDDKVEALGGNDRHALVRSWRGEQPLVGTDLGEPFATGWWRVERELVAARVGCVEYP